MQLDLTRNEINTVVCALLEVSEQAGDDYDGNHIIDKLQAVTFRGPVCQHDFHIVVGGVRQGVVGAQIWEQCNLDNTAGI